MAYQKNAFNPYMQQYEHFGGINPTTGAPWQHPSQNAFMYPSETQNTTENHSTQPASSASNALPNLNTHFAPEIPASTVYSGYFSGSTNCPTSTNCDYSSNSASTTYPWSGNSSIPSGHRTSDTSFTNHNIPPPLSLLPRLRTSHSKTDPFHVTHALYYPVHGLPSQLGPPEIASSGDTPEEDDSSSGEPSAKRCRLTSEPAGSPKTKRARDLEKNRVAAAKCRNKKRENDKETEEKSRILMEHNKHLKIEIERHRQQYIELRQEMLAHAGDLRCMEHCSPGDGPLMRFVRASAKKIVPRATMDELMRDPTVGVKGLAGLKRKLKKGTKQQAADEEEERRELAEAEVYYDPRDQY
ncbi:MAG: hypothetical protein M1828_000185 [Chrysothrix sp. TS-e1954]|nr:MAG: hypothetical protein M1828_000185 [Chrysothrix sp. TS-e1954]